MGIERIKTETYSQEPARLIYSTAGHDEVLASGDIAGAKQLSAQDPSLPI